MTFINSENFFCEVIRGLTSFQGCSYCVGKVVGVSSVGSEAPHTGSSVEPANRIVVGLQVRPVQQLRTYSLHLGELNVSVLTTVWAAP